MKVLVAAAAYPMPSGQRPLYYVHSRNIHYREAGMDVTVLNFAANESYDFEGFRVITVKEFAESKQQYDLLVCHAANLRNHYLFLLKYGNHFSKIVFFFHGHEVLHINRYYPKPYDYDSGHNNKKILQDRYDDLKLLLWKRYIKKNICRIRLVFVSPWIFAHFLQETGLKEDDLLGNWQIIPNGVGNFFENNSYTPVESTTDFITIRNNFDGSTYCLDVITELARRYPLYRFLVIGKGRFFDLVRPPDNLTVLKKELSHQEIACYLNAAKYALMPVRQDTQGLMACEMATYGLPLITSDIEVCRMVFESCPHVAFISNDDPRLELAIEKLKTTESSSKWEEYSAKNTILKEIEYLKLFSRHS